MKRRHYSESGKHENTHSTDLNWKKTWKSCEVPVCTTTGEGQRTCRDDMKSCSSFECKGELCRKERRFKSWKFKTVCICKCRTSLFCSWSPGILTLSARELRPQPIDFWCKNTSDYLFSSTFQCTGDFRGSKNSS